MKPAVVDRKVTSGGMLSTVSFGISMSDQAHILSILRDKMYSNKVLAVLREYSSNAMDAHVVAGKADVPIEISLPTNLDRSVIIRDFGPGLAESEIAEVFVLYGASTKRDSNDEIGAFGIGGKSAFAYNDQFTITSFYGGTKTVYIACLDETNVGTLSKFYAEPCGAETGVEIKIPVNPQDTERFHTEAAKLFQWFVPQPVINTALRRPYAEPGMKPSGRISSGTGWRCVVGGVPYTIDVAQVEHRLPDDADVVHGCLSQMSGLLRLQIGDVDVSASREELEYSPRTIESIARRITDLVQERVDALTSRVQAAPDPWHLRMLIVGLAQDRDGLLLDTEYREYKDSLVDLTRRVDGHGQTVSSPTTFALYSLSHTGRRRRASGRALYDKRPVHRVAVSTHTMLLIVDTDRPLDHYDAIELYAHRRYLVSPLTRPPVVDPTTGAHTFGAPFTVEEVLKELNELVHAAELTGIPIKRLSDLAYTVPPTVGTDSRYRKRLFKLRRLPRGSKAIAQSSFWEVTDDFPEGALVVPLVSFIPSMSVGKVGWDSLHADEHALPALGIPCPDIYGIKVSPRYPLKGSELEKMGVQLYSEWANEVYLHAAADRATRDALTTYEMATHRLGGDFVGSYGRPIRTARKVVTYLRAVLGAQHLVTAFFQRFVESHEDHEDLTPYQQAQLSHLVARIRATEKAAFTRKRDEELVLARAIHGPLHQLEPTRRLSTLAQRALDRIKSRYPLLDAANGGPGVQVMADHGRRHLWVDYIKVVDAQRQQSQEKK